MQQMRCQILVIGSGPGGAVTADELARRGHDVLLAEQGPDTRMSVVPPYSSAEMDLRYRNAGLTPFFGRGRVTLAEARCLGGGSEVNSGFFHRTPPEILAQWREQSGINDLTEDALSGYFDDIARSLQVTELQETEDRVSLRLKLGSDRLGWVSQQIPRWVSSHRDAAGRWHSRRNGMSATFLASAMAAGCRVVAGLEIVSLSLEGDRAVAAHGFLLDGYRRGDRATIRFDHVFVCAGATATPLLLRRSGLRRNIGNSLMVHPMVRAIAHFDDETSEPDFGVPVRQVMEFKPHLTLGCSVSTTPHLSLWMTGQNPELLQQQAKRLAVFYALVTSSTLGTVRSLPRLPEPVVRYHLQKSDYASLARGLRLLVQLLFAAGARRLYLPLRSCPVLDRAEQLDAHLAHFAKEAPEVTAIHAFGSVPMAADAQRGAVDANGLVFDTTNVYVNDASMLPGYTGVNPQGTIMAMAKRNLSRFGSTGS